MRSIADDIMTIITFDGSVETSRNGQTTDEWREVLEAVAEDLQGFITPRLGRVKPDISELGPSWPRDDIPVGRAMKYLRAWRAVDQEALEESRFFSIA
jgi:hypothetical protein